ncbi:MAG: PilZ domain-containing protein [Proteobacteria bacterium]|nr:MAG: PilZ domain-containing protein [Pseudomonadota bacterium]
MKRTRPMAQPDQNTDDPVQQNRAKRFLSHTLVELRQFKHLPFFCYSAVVLDISSGGFKLEFTGETVSVPGKRYWLHIPLMPLGISSPSSFSCLCECRWFDPKRFRMGGSFVNPTADDIKLIEKVMASIKTRGQL